MTNYTVTSPLITSHRSQPSQVGAIHTWSGNVSFDRMSNRPGRFPPCLRNLDNNLKHVLFLLFLFDFSIQLCLPNLSEFSLKLPNNSVRISSYAYVMEKQAK